MKYISKTASQLVHVIEGENGRFYVGLAKFGLWVCALTLAFVIFGGLRRAFAGDTAVVGNMIQACQVLAMIAISVLGYHGYSGNRIFHALRHWNDGKPETNE